VQKHELVRTIRLLVCRHYDLNSKHFTSILLEAILPILRTKARVQLIWLFYLPDRIKLQDKKIDNDTIFLDVHDYKNAVEIIKHAKPDLIFDNEYPALMDLALDMAAKHLNVPVVTRMFTIDNSKISKKQLFTTFIPTFFHSTLYNFETNPKKKFMRRGRFFIYKYLFLLKTMKAVGMNVLEIIKHFFIVLNIHLSYREPFIDPRFANTLHLLQGELLRDPMVKAGFDESRLVVTGNPMYDEAFKRFQNVKHFKNTDSIKILFLPLQLYEGGLWTKKQRDVATKKIVEGITKEKGKFSLIVKLHPSSQLFEDYFKIINSIDPSVPIYQKEDLIDFFEKTDVVISYPPISSALIYALIAQKPIILCNFFNERKGILIERGLAQESKDPSQLAEIIKKVSVSETISKQNLNNFFMDYLYSTDGNSAERVCDAIQNLLNKNNSSIKITKN